MRAAIAISTHALDDLDSDAVMAKLDELVELVGCRVQHGGTRAIQAHLHHVLFEEYGFRGNTEMYYSALNSYVPAVLLSRRGIPITLALIYKYVGEQLGLEIEGLNAPGHFLVQVGADNEKMIVDPFQGGRVLTRDEALRLLRRITNRPLTAHPSLLQPATNVQWLERILGNLRELFSALEHPSDFAAMTELRGLLLHAAAH